MTFEITRGVVTSAAQAQVLRSVLAPALQCTPRI
jgi:hypothetical protein